MSPSNLPSPSNQKVFGERYLVWYRIARLRLKSNEGYSSGWLECGILASIGECHGQWQCSCEHLHIHTLASKVFSHFSARRADSLLSSDRLQKSQKEWNEDVAPSMMLEDNSPFPRSFTWHFEIFDCCICIGDTIQSVSPSHNPLIRTSSRFTGISAERPF